MPTTYPSAKRFLNVSVETTQGTPVMTSPITVPVNDFQPEDKPKWLKDQALRGSMVETYGQVQGPKMVEWTIPDSPCFIDVLGYFLKNILGDLTTTGPVSSSYVHAFAALNSGTAQPGSLTGTQWQGLPTNNARSYPGMCLSELTMKGNAETSMIEWSAKGMAWPSQDAAGAPTSAPSTASPLAAWRYVLGIGGPASGGTQVLTTAEWSVTIARKLRAQWTGQNSQSPFIIQRGPLAVTGALKFAKPSDESAFDYMINNTQPALQIKAVNGLAGASLLSLQIDSAVTAFETAKINFGEEAIGYDTTFEAIANTTNAGASGGYSPGKYTIETAITTYGG
jgi:hypothetical protein